MDYLNLEQIFALVAEPNRGRLRNLFENNHDTLARAPGSSKNHQAWDGGFLDHTLETANIAVWLHTTSPRALPFSLGEALTVMLLHDIEKPWKYSPVPVEYDLHDKRQRKIFRNTLIEKYHIELDEDQRNALLYVEGVPDAEYTPQERTMGGLAAFCHCCDILSARLWYDCGKPQRLW